VKKALALTKHANCFGCQLQLEIPIRDLMVVSSTWPMPSRDVIIGAYRDLYRAGLRAVQYSSPARYTIRDRLRRAFRECPIQDFEPQRITNTLEFLEGARKSNGLEHHVLRNLLMVWYYEPFQWMKRKDSRDTQDLVARVRAYDSFHHTLRMLNESMGLCLR
jgi:hypothetical protein